MRFLRTESGGYVLVVVLVVLALLSALAMRTASRSASGVHSVGLQHDDRALDLALEGGVARARWLLARSACENHALGDTRLSGLALTTRFAPTDGSPVAVRVVASGAGGLSRARELRLPAYSGDPQRLTLQPGPASARDAEISSSRDDDNHGLSTRAEVKNGRRMLIGFDLANLPADVLVRAARLTLYKNSGSGDISVHRLLNAWTQGSGDGEETGDGVTWNSRDGSRAWTVPGGDFHSESVAGFSVQNSDAEVTVDITELVSGWHDGRFANHGLILVGRNVTFMTADGPAVTRPRLEIDFSCECGVSCVPPPLPACVSDYSPDSNPWSIDLGGFGLVELRGLAALPAGHRFNASVAPAEGAWLALNRHGRLVMLADDGSVMTECNVSRGGDEPQGLTLIQSGLYAGRLAVAYDALGDDRLEMLDAACQTQASLPLNVDGVTGVAYIGKTASGSHEGRLAVATSGSTRHVRVYTQNAEPRVDLDVSGLVGDLQGLAHLQGSDRLLLADAISGAGAVVIDVVNGDGGSAANSYPIAALGVDAPRAVAVGLTSCEHAFGSPADNRLRALANSASVVAGATPGDSSCTGEAADEFEPMSYANQRGTVPWSGDWQEYADFGSFLLGAIRITLDGGALALSIENGASAPGILRQVDLSDYTSAVLSVRYRRERMKGPVAVTLEVSANGGTSWTQLHGFSGPDEDADYQLLNIDISAYIGTSTAIRFATTSDMHIQDRLFIDAVSIAASGCAGG
ncbi:MAG: DNRLRE domain-containing protein [Gammaproteobacteria bacterium]|nr:DNRLRE domain-containing protein [Gammaproteobacteria bacterium]